MASSVFFSAARDRFGSGMIKLDELTELSISSKMKENESKICLKTFSLRSVGG